MEANQPVVLISPLGLSPGAVSGVFFELKLAQNVDLRRVVTIGPDDEQNRDMKNVLTILDDLFRGHGLGSACYPSVAHPTRPSATGGCHPSRALDIFPVSTTVGHMPRASSFSR